MLRLSAWILGAILLVALIAGCGSKKGSGPETGYTPPIDRFSQAIGEVNAAEKPDGVEATVWDELQAELARVLKARQDGTLRTTSELEPVVDLRLAGSKLCWTQRLVGDYDNNGMVSVGDLTPLGVLYDKSVPATATERSAYCRVDGDGNGVITAADITPLGVHYGETIIGYRVMRAASESGHGAVEVAYLEKPDSDGALGDTSVYSYEPSEPGYYSVVPRGAGQTSAARSTFVANGNGGSGNIEVPPPFTSPDANPGQGTISGRVSNQFGDPVDHGIIRVPGVGSVRSNEDGFFNIPGVGASTAQSILTGAAGCATSHDVTFVDGQSSRYVDITVLETEICSDINVTTGGNVVSPLTGTRISIAPNSFVDSAGNPITDDVTISLTSLDVTNPNQLAAAPGSFNAVEDDGTTSMLETYSMVDFSATDQFGNPVVMRDGATAELLMPVPAEIRDTAPPVIGLYIFDNNDSVWVRAAIATLNTDRTFYVADVDLPGWWNCDDQLYVRDPAMGPTWAFIEIQVVDQVGQPIRGAFVSAQGMDFISLPRAVTDDNGIATIEVNPNSTLRIQAEYDGVYRSLGMEVDTPTAPEATKRVSVPITLPDLPRFSINLSWTEIPSDLDLRLKLPDGNVCGYSQMEIGGAYLVTDDFDGFGPERVRVSELQDGMYDVYVVKCPSLVDGPFTKSAARVSISGRNLDLSEYMIPLINVGNYNTWHVCRIQVSNAGESIFVHGVNQFIDSY